MAESVRKDRKAIAVHLGPMARQAHKVRWVRKGMPAQPGPKEPKEPKGLRDQQDRPLAWFLALGRLLIKSSLMVFYIARI